MSGPVTVVRWCAAENCAWNEEKQCMAREITITVNRRGGMSCWNYTDALSSTEQNGKKEE